MTQRSSSTPFQRGDSAMSGAVRTPQLFFRASVILLASVCSFSIGCRSTLLNSRLGAELDRSLDTELAELGGANSANESRAGSSVRPHPLTQRLRPGGTAPAPTARKKMADQRRLQRPGPEQADETEVDSKERAMLMKFAEESSGASGSSEVDEQRARIQDEIRRRQSQSTASEVVTAREDQQGEDPFEESSKGKATVFTLSDVEKPMGVRRINSDQIPKVPAMVSHNATESNKNGARIRFTDRDNSVGQTTSVEKLLGPVTELRKEKDVIYAGHESPRRSKGSVSDFPEEVGSGRVLTPITQQKEVSGQNAPTAMAPSQLGPEELMEALFAQLDEDYAAASSPQARINIEKKKRLLSMVADDIKAATSPIDGLQPEAQEYIQKTLTALYDATDDAGHPSMTRRLTRALESHREAADDLARVASLRVVSPAFCTEVDSFGVIKKFDSYSFQQDQEVLLYCELENFASKQVNGGYETRLQGSYEIVDAQGSTVLEQVLPKDSDICANQRRDFYIAYRLFMPVRIDPGAYQLKLYVEDIHGKKFGQAEIDFRIVNAK
ncbi:MAG: hypothetical protein ACE361_14300 [Aureliella sp.]